MSSPILALSLIVLPISVLSQQTSNTNPPPQDFTPRFNGPTAVLIAVLITAFLFMGFFAVYLRHCGSPDRDPTTAGRPVTSRSRRARGLDPEVISSFPTLVYSDVKQHKLGKNTLECAVCLSDFDDDDALRLLPHCSHAFHPDCIDAWLASHSTCPVCRHNLAEPPPPQPRADPEPDPEAQDTPPQQVAIRVEADAEERSWSRRTRVPSLWRSRTTAGPHWPAEERERFTLRLPEHIRREVFAGKLRRSLTMGAVEGRGRRGEGSSRGARSFKMGREWSARSERWAFLARPLSFNFSRIGRDRDPSASGSSKWKASSSSVMSPRDCLGVGTERTVD